MRGSQFIVGLFVFSAVAFGQTSDDQGAASTLKGVETPSPFTIHHSVSFGMASGGGTGSLQSGSFYSTMMQYQFAAPVTLNLNFSLPIYSSFSPYQNLSAKNIQSLDYFKSIPFDASFAWKPTDRFQFNVSIVNRPMGYGYGYGMLNSGLPWESWPGR